MQFADHDRGWKVPQLPHLPRVLHAAFLCMQVREVVNDFYSSRYASSLAQLNKLMPVLRLDLHLADHVDALYKDVSNTGIRGHTV